MTDELAVQLANAYDRPASVSEFRAATKLDFCIFLKTLYEQTVEIVALKEKLLESRLTPLDFFRLMDPHCRCRLDVRDVCAFVEPFANLGNFK